MFRDNEGGWPRHYHGQIIIIATTKSNTLTVITFNTVFFYCSIGKGKQTIVPKMEGKTIGQRKMMSKTDCLKINDLYGCLGTPPNYNYKYYTLCNYMGL